MNNMKSLKQHINEKLVLNSNSKIRNPKEYIYHPKTKEELVEIIKAEVEKDGWKCNFNHIDVSKITDMSYLFSSNRFYGYNLDKFNGDISRWNVSNVEDMRCMFLDAESFNQPIGDWDVSKVTTMESMFDGAYLFNQPIGDWDISNVTDMRWMFFEAYSFNQDLSKWKLKPCIGAAYIVDKCPIKDEYKPKFKK